MTSGSAAHSTLTTSIPRSRSRSRIPRKCELSLMSTATTVSPSTGSRNEPHSMQDGSVSGSPRTTTRYRLDREPWLTDSMGSPCFR